MQIPFINNKYNDLVYVKDNNIYFDDDKYHKDNDSLVPLIKMAINNRKVYQVLKESLINKGSINLEGLSKENTSVGIYYDTQELKEFFKENLGQFNILERRKIRELESINTYEYYYRHIKDRKVDNKRIDDIIKLLSSNDVLSKISNTNLEELLLTLNKDPIDIGGVNICTRFNFPIEISNKIMGNVRMLYRVYASTIIIDNNVSYYDLYRYFYNFNSSTKDDYEYELKSKKVLGLDIEDVVNKLKKIWLGNEVLRDFKNMGLDYFVEHYSRVRIDKDNFIKHKTNLDKVKIDSDFKNSLLREISNTNFNELEKIYYLYRRLCEKLSYDDLYMAMGDVVNIPHKSLERIESINDKNNLVICHEFVLIFTKLCDSLGIPSQILNGQNRIKTEESLFQGHSKAVILVNDFIIHVDSTKSVLSSDIAKEKLGMNLEGFEYLGSSILQQEEFRESLNKVNEYLAKKEKDFKYIDSLEILKRRALRANIVTLEEKKSIILSMFKDYVHKDTQISDMAYFLLKCRDAIYGSSNYCNIKYIVRNKPLKVVSLITFSSNGDLEDIENNEYYLYEGDIFYNVLSSKVEELFTSGAYRFIEGDKDKSLPGIGEISVDVRRV